MVTSMHRSCLALTMRPHVEIPIQSCRNSIIRQRWVACDRSAEAGQQAQAADPDTAAAAAVKQTPLPLSDEQQESEPDSPDHAGRALHTSDSDEQMAAAQDGLRGFMPGGDDDYDEELALVSQHAPARKYGFSGEAYAQSMLVGA